MKIIKRAFLILMFAFAPKFGYCDVVLPWSYESGSASAITMHIVTDRESLESQAILVKAEINHSAGGEKNIYFSLQAHEKNKSTCTPSSEHVTRKVIYFDGQAIKMMGWCKKFADNDTYYSEYTAATYPGADYIVNLFKTKHDNIVINFSNMESEISAKNFSAVWEKFGGDAL